MSHYTTSIELQGEPAQVLRNAMAILAANGFKLEKVLDSGVEMVGPLMRSTKQHPLVGASRVALQIVENQLDIDAELGGVDRMRKFLHWFPLILGTSIGLVLGIVQGLIMGQVFGVGFGIPGVRGPMWIVVSLSMGLLPVVPWLVLSPLMSRWIRKRTEAAIDALGDNANLICQVSESKV